MTMQEQKPNIPKMDIIDEVKAVKNSIFYRIRVNDICSYFVAHHYNTDILTVEYVGGEYKVLSINWYSVTSSKMIRRCLDYLGLNPDRKYWEKQNIPSSI